ncbi:M23 family metallopeptidase [Halalkalibacter krulwichiae]|uniref:Peptidase family M23 n=1 Tax=Halalkalibacter krulwichiae TaxID=199441 RepID=A0A1X9MKV0_9BACI|nr:M23 family metallopeptidase [Halalkalibacter krulwichiae]ARK32351.1 Peptidase family M23 [Halalkalibacter krulwichiae]
MTLAIIQLIVFQFVLPATLLSLLLWKGTHHCKLHWLVHVVALSMYMTWIFLTGRWDWLGYYFRYLWVVLPLVVFYLSWRKVRHLPFRSGFTRSQKWSFALDGFLLTVFGLYSLFALSSLTTEDEAIELVFPLEDGHYYVGQGGNHPMMNYHNAYLPQQYALDVTQLNAFGFRTKGIYPSELEKYEIYGAELYSPCTGEVLEARNDLPDYTPPESDPTHPEGNYVALSCVGSEAIVFIAHMQEGTVQVEEGMSVEVGDFLGLIGNSGNTTEPHLHIHAEKDGVGVPMRFAGKFLVRNSVVRR